MNTRLYKIILFIVGLLTLAVMVNSLGLDTILANMQLMGYWFIPVIGSWLLIYLFNAWAFYAIIHEPALPETRLSFSYVLKLTISGYAINYITPFVSLGGEPYRVMELEKKIGLKKATSSVLLYGLMHMFSHVIFWLASVGLIIAFVPMNQVIMTGSLILLVVGSVLIYWFIKVYKQGFTVSTIRSLSKVPFLKARMQKLMEEKQAFLEGTDQQIRELYADRRPVFYKSLVLEFIARVIGSAEIYYTALAIGLDMTWIQALVVSSGSSLFANLIFFFPMQLGTREGGLALALKSIGFAGTHGIFIGVITRIREIVWIIIGLALMDKGRRHGQPLKTETDSPAVIN